MAKQTFTTGQVLTAAQMTSLQQTAMGGGSATTKTASYTLVAADAGTTVTMTSASATTITVNTSLFAAGDTVYIQNLGAGVSTITAGTATVNTSASLALAQYEGGQLYFNSTSAAIFIKGAAGAAASGGMTLLSTTTLTGNNVTISSISQDYVNLYILITGVTNATMDGALRVRPDGSTNNGLTGQVTGTNYNAFSNISLSFEQSMLRTSANNAFALNIFNYTSTTTYKPFTFSGFYESSGPTNQYVIGGGGTSEVSAIDNLFLFHGGGAFLTGTVTIYGVK